MTANRASYARRQLRSEMPPRSEPLPVSRRVHINEWTIELLQQNAVVALPDDLHTQQGLERCQHRLAVAAFEGPADGDTRKRWVGDADLDGGISIHLLEHFAQRCGAKPQTTG